MRILQMNKDTSKRKDQYNSSLLPEENTAHTLNIQGYQHLLKGEAEEALSYFQRALALAPENPIILNNMGNALLNLNRFDAAQEAYQQAIAANLNYLKPYRNLALLYQLQGKNNEAIAAYLKYLDLAPDDGEAHHNLGLLYMTEGRTTEAVDAFEAASVYLTPTDAESTTNLGVGNFYRGDLDRAEYLFEQALALDPSYVPARYHLGLTYLHRGRCEEAIESLEAVVATEPDHPQAAANLGVAYNTAGQPEKAIAIFETLLKKQPDNPSIILNLGYACQDAGFIERAVEYFQQVIAMTGPGTSYTRKARQALSEITANRSE